MTDDATFGWMNRQISRRQALRLSAAGLLVPSALAGCGGSTVGGSEPGGSPATGRMSPERFGGAASGALSTEFGTFDPAFATTVGSVIANVHAFEALYEQRFYGERELVPALAVDEPTRVDDTTYRVGIRPDAVFHDGSAVTSDDVVYSFRRVLSSEGDTASIFAEFVPFIDAVRRVDRTTVEFTLAHPTTLLAARSAVVKIVPRDVVERVSGEEFGANPVGSGPYEFVRAVENDRIAYRRFADYSGPSPGHLDDLTLRILTDGPARVAAVRAGQVDLAADPPDRDVPQLRNEPALEVAVARPSTLQTFLMFNCARRPFGDRRVRQALHYAIDRDAVTQVAFGGNAKPATAYLPDGHPSFARPSTVYGHDPERARALLRDAGVERLRFTLQVFDTPWNRQSATIIRQNWQDVGVSAELFVAGEAIYDNVFDGSYQAQLAISDVGVLGYDGQLLMAWHYGRTWRDGLYYWTGKESREMQRLLDEALRAAGDEQRQQLLADAQELAAQEVPLHPVHHRSAITAWDGERVENVTPLLTGGLDMRTAQLKAA